MTTSADAGLLGAADTAHLAFASTEQRVLFTHDHHFLILHSQGIDHAGITYCHQQSRSVGEIIRALELIWEILEPEEMWKRVEFV